MTVYTEPNYLGDIVKHEAAGRYSREVVTILAGDGAARELPIGSVLGFITKGAPVAAANGNNTGDGAAGAVTLGALAQVGIYALTCVSAAAAAAGAAVGAADAGNTGQGTITAAPAVGAGAKPGVYRVTCIEPAAGAGVFTVEDPDGVEVGVATVGVEFVGGGLTFTIADGDPDFVAGDVFTVTVAAAEGTGGVFQVVAPDGATLPPLTAGAAYAGGHINLTIASGDTGFVVGDSFTVTVPAGSGKAVALDPTATDGSQVAGGVLLAGVTAPDGVDAQGVALVRGEAVVAASKLAWLATVEANHKTVALAQLAACGIITRPEA